MAKTMFEKIWEAHEVRPPEREGGASLIYVDLHLVHEVTSAQAFEGLRLAGRKVRRPDRTLATADHNVPTDPARAHGPRRDQRPPLAQAGRGARAQLRRVRHPASTACAARARASCT